MCVNWCVGSELTALEGFSHCNARPLTVITGDNTLPVLRVLEDPRSDRAIPAAMRISCGVDVRDDDESESSSASSPVEVPTASSTESDTGSESGSWTSETHSGSETEPDDAASFPADVQNAPLQLGRGCCVVPSLRPR